jgi:hypothetical protein
MAWTANPDHLLHNRAIEIAFIPLVTVACARDEMMSRERFLTLANRADRRRRHYEYKYSS